jgi:hypothetical protein
MTEPAIDSGALAELDALLSDPARMAASLSSLAVAARAEFAAHEARINAKMERLLAAQVAQSAEDAAREKTLTQREAAVAEREAAVAEKDQRVTARERWCESKAADLQQRYSGAA